MSGQEPKRYDLKPAGTTTDSLNLQVSLCTYGAALGLFLWFAEGSVAWVIGAAVAVALGILIILDVMKWNRAGVLRKSLGTLHLSTDSQPLRVGDEFHVWVTHQVKSELRITVSTLRLHCDTARIETFGIRDRERKVWGNVTKTEIHVLRDSIVEAGSAMTMDARGTIPQESLCTGDQTRWWLVLETTIEGMPDYSADFALEVVAKTS